MIYSKSYSEYKIIPSLDYIPSGLILFGSYKIAIDDNYEKVFKEVDLITAREGKCYYPTEYWDKHRWAVEQLAAYYGKFMIIFRRDRQR